MIPTNVGGKSQEIEHIYLKKITFESTKKFIKTTKKEKEKEKEKEKPLWKFIDQILNSLNSEKA